MKQYRVEEEDMATASEMVRIIEDALRDNAGVKQITVDGQTIQFDRVQLLEELDYWKRKAAETSGKRRLFRGVNLNGF